MMTKVETDTFVYATYIQSTPEKIWQALTTGDFTKQYWFGFRIDVEPKAGGQVTYVPPKGSTKTFSHHEGKVLTWEPYRKFSYTWMPMCGSDGETKQPDPSRVTFELTPKGTVVKLRVIHENLSPEEVEKEPNTFKGINNGWPAVISSLKSLLETGHAMPLDLP